jgi:hypothetical protein
MANTKAVMVASVIAIRKGRLLSSAKGVRDVMPNSNASRAT